MKGSWVHFKMVSEKGKNNPKGNLMNMIPWHFNALSITF